MRAGAAAAADGFVVGPSRRRPRATLLHRPATGGGDAIRQGLGKRAEDDVDDALAGLGVARDDGGGVLRVEDASRGG